MTGESPHSAEFFHQSGYNQLLGMPEETPSTPPPVTAPPVAAPPTSFRIGEEFGTAEKNLPPIKIVSIAIGVVLLVVAVLAFVQRPKSSATGAIDQVVSVEIPGQGAVMAAINVSFRNNGDKPFWIRSIQGELQTGGKSYTDDGASPIDFDRYYQAFPALKQYAVAPLQREAKIEPGGETSGTVIVSFPVTPDAFSNRTLLKVTIQPYDQPAPLVLTK
jgi:hypothetical protein